MGEPAGVAEYREAMTLYVARLVDRAKGYAVSVEDVSAVRERIDALFRELLEDRADLDWLEAQGLWQDDHLWNLDMRDLCYGFEDLRTAIRAARRAQDTALPPREG